MGSSRSSTLSTRSAKPARPTSRRARLHEQSGDRCRTGARAALGVDHLRAARGVAAASSHAAADAALSRPLDPRDHLSASGAGLWRPLHGHRTEAGAGRRRFAKPRLGYTRAADLLPGSCRLDVFMNRDPRFALSQEVEAKQTLLDQLRALAADDPDFFTDLTEQKPAA